MATTRATQATSPLLQRRLVLPRFLEDAGDLVAAAWFLTVIEWRAWLVWALAFGVPRTLLRVALTPVAGLHEISGPGWGEALTTIAIEPLAAACAFLFLKARWEARPVGLQTFTGGTLARLGPLLAWAAALQGFTILLGAAQAAVSGFLGLGALLGWIGAIALLSVVYAGTITVGPRLVIEPVGLPAALGRSFADFRASAPALVAACAILLLMGAELAEGLSSPSMLAYAPGCVSEAAPSLLGPLSCSPWWQVIYAWLLQALPVPLYAMAFVVYARPRDGETAR